MYLRHAATAGPRAGLPGEGRPRWSHPKRLVSPRQQSRHPAIAHAVPEITRDADRVKSDRSLSSCEKMRPQAGVGKLKHAPPMRANDLPLVAQAVPPANRIISWRLKIGAPLKAANAGPPPGRERSL